MISSFYFTRFDAMAVVEPRSLKIHGISNLRVVDASILPTMPSGNINIPIVMIAEKAADLIKSELLNSI